VHRHARHGRLPVRVTFWPCTVCGAALEPSLHENISERVDSRFEEVGEPQLQAGAA
jgi:hypothetical protein